MPRSKSPHHKPLRMSSRDQPNAPRDVMKELDGARGREERVALLDGLQGREIDDWEDSIVVDSSEVSEYAFEGFEPAVTRRAFMSVASGSHTRDLVALLSVACHLGPNSNKYSSRLKERSAAQITALLNQYEIKRSVGVARSKTVLTLPRLMSSFPAITAQILSVIGVRDGIDSPLPAPYRFPAGASIIPHSAHDLLGAFRSWALKYDTLINPGKADPGRVDRFIIISHDSTFVSENRRSAIYRKYIASPPIGFHDAAMH